MNNNIQNNDFCGASKPSPSTNYASTNMAKISLSFESHGIGCTPPTGNISTAVINWPYVHGCLVSLLEHEENIN